MNIKTLQLKRALHITLFILLLSAMGLTNAMGQPTGAINGLFSVSENVQVYFSQGNLQYQASTDTWRFAENQWDYVGTQNPSFGEPGGTVSGSDNTNISPIYDGWIDLFGWGTSGYNHGAVCYQPWSTSTVDNDYFVYGGMYHLYDQTGQADWGYNAISNGGNAANSGWRTLTEEEWKYLFNTRNTMSGIRWAQGCVNGVNGIIILPDNWTASVYMLNDTNGGNYSSNIITAEDWTNVLETHGALFLPAAGWRHTSDGTGVSSTGERGFYWSSSRTNQSWYAYCIEFESDGVFDLCEYNFHRHLGSSVRLVHSFVVKVTSNPEEGGEVNGGGAYTEGTTCMLTATANSDYIFGNWTENGEVVSTEATYSFTVTRNRNLVANFLYAISAVVMPKDGGTVNGIGMNEIDSLHINYNFNSGLQGWSTIDADGDGNDWYVWFASNPYVVSASWSSGVGALYPDNYLVSPWVALGGSITFKARAGDNAYAAEHFGVAVSTTGTNASDFVTVQEWTMSAKAVGNWYEYTVDLSSFNGMGYVAIRHFNCSDMFWLNIDDVAIETPSSFTAYTGGYEEGQTCTVTAVPKVGWEFNNWMENGAVVSTEATYNFTVTGGKTIVANFTEVSGVTQTTALSRGWNWYSTYIEQEGIDGLGQLENSIGVPKAIIQSQGDGYVKSILRNGNVLWGGALSSINNEEMYKIGTKYIRTATIEGQVTDPSSHPITINKGWNWIGFPCSQSVSVNEALSGFTPKNGDLIKGIHSYATYNNGTWTGTLNTLEPGQGYMYGSKDRRPKTLVYQSSRGEATQANITPANNYYQPSDDYADNMTLVAVVELDGNELRSEDYELAAFVGDECRGSVKLMYVAPIDRYIAFLTVFGELEEELSFRLTDGFASSLSADRLTYVVDNIAGTLDEPVALRFGATYVNENALANVSVYPNPSEGLFNIEGNGIRRIEVVNVYGQVILSKEVGDYSAQIDLSDNAAGIYLLRVVTDGGITTSQIIKR